MTIYKIGRAEGNDIVLGEKSVSRHHAELEELGAGRFRLKDLGSSQGTQMLSGSEWVEVKESEIRHDTKVRLGEYETTPMDLIRDQDKTQVQARPSTPPAPVPAAAPPRPAAPQIDQLTLSPGQPGRLLNIVDSMPPLEDALKSAQKRTAELVVEDQTAPPPTLEQLKQLLQARLAAFQGTASVFVKDLQTGEELQINPNVPFSGGGVMKLPIVAEIYRKYDLPLDITTTQRLTVALTTELSNLPANQLLNQIGEGNTFAGADTTTASLSHLGLRNSYLAQPFDQPITATAGISTPANTAATINTNASPAMQTTASDMGLLWEMIDQCSHGGGALLVVYPHQYSPIECRQLIQLLQVNTPADIPALLNSGLPAQAQSAHRPGGTFDTRGDAALVHSPGGDYILVVFLNTAAQNFDWTAANAIMADLSKAAYNYFNLGR